jgi:hypothetical protein
MPRSWILVLILVLACKPADVDRHEANAPSEGTALESIDTAGINTNGMEATPQQAAFRDEWVENAFLPSGSTLDTLRAAFGEPDSIVGQAVSNEYDSTVTDTVFRVVYNAGLRAWLHWSRDGEFIMRAEIAASRYLRRRTVEIGSPWKEVLKKFGPPWGEFEGAFYYDSGRRIGPEEPVYFELQDDAVKLIRYDYYTG